MFTGGNNPYIVGPTCPEAATHDAIHAERIQCDGHEVRGARNLSRRGSVVGGGLLSKQTRAKVKRVNGYVHMNKASQRERERESERERERQSEREGGNNSAT